MNTPPHSSFDVVLADALARRRVTLSWLHRRLLAEGHPISMATLSYWRSGQRQPEHARSLDVVEEIERLLDLAPQTLVRAIGPARRRGPRSKRAVPEHVLTEASDARAVLAELGFPDGWPANLEKATVDGTLDLDEHGREVVNSTRMRLRARDDGADRFPRVLRQEHVPDEPATLAPVAGCRVDGYAERSRISGWSLVLDRPLVRLETALVEVRVETPGTVGPTTRFAHHVASRVSEISLWVRFHPDRLPERCFARLGAPDTAPEQKVALQGSSAHVIATGFGPGRIELGWVWPAER